MACSSLASKENNSIPTAVASKPELVTPAPKTGRALALSPQLTRLDLILIGLVTIVAAFFRLYQIEAIPPGLHYDEAFEGLVAKEVLETGRLKIFFEGNFGLEPLSVYLVVGLYLLFGVSATTVRLMPAIAGILTVPALYLLVRELFPAGLWPKQGQIRGVSEQQLSRILAFLSALSLASLFWHVSFSRYGVESNLVPLFEVLLFYFLWRGFRTGSLRSFAASGVLLGLSLYTYQAARMLPILVALFFAYRLLGERRRFFSAYWKGAVVLGVTAIITFAPLGQYFLTHPAAFIQRAGQVQTVTEDRGAVSLIAENTRKTAAMFLMRGDEDPRSNLPGRPAVDPILAIPFLLGAALTLYRLYRPQYGFLIVWLVVMLIPTLISEYAPHFRRSLGATPVVATTIGLGLASILGAGFWLAARVRDSLGRALRAGTAIALAAIVLSSTFITYRDYFLIWGRSPDLFAAFDVGIMEVVRRANGLPTDSEIYLSPVPRTHATVEYASRSGRRLRSFDGRRGFVVPAKSDVDANYFVITDEDSRSLKLLQGYFPAGRPVVDGRTWDGRPYFSLFFVPAGSHRNTLPAYPLKASLANKVAFLGYNIPWLTYKPGDVIPIVLYWQALQPMEESYTVFTHLLGPWDDKNKTAVWGQMDSLPVGGTYLTSDWDKGDVILDEYAIPIRKDAPAGEYEIEVGMYLLANLQRLPALDPASGQAIGDRVVLGKVMIVDK